MSRFCVVLAEQPHRQCFAEVVTMLLWGLRELAHEVEVSTVQRPGARNIILAPHLLLASEEHPHIDAGTIVYNFEPYCSPLFVRSLRLLGHPHAQAWDFHPVTTKYLAELGIAAKTVPFAWCPPHAREHRANVARDIDVLFMGSLSPRRVDVLNKLLRVPELVTTRALFGVYGAERDQALARSKVCLNLHYWDEWGCEDLRLHFAAAHGVANVSEGAPDEPRKRAWASWVPYDELGAECIRLVQSGAWVAQATEGRAACQQIDAATVLAEALR